MRPRERVLSAINRKITDRPPIFASFTPQIGDAFNKLLNITDDGLVDSFFANRISYTKALTQLGNDCVCVAVCWPEGVIPRDNGDGSTDEWGITCRNTGMYYEMVSHPLANIETVNDLYKFKFPDALAKGRFDHAEKQINKYGSDYGIIAEQECTVFELSWYLVGLEKFLLDMMMEKPYIPELLDIVMDISLKQATKLVEMGVDIVWTGDDIGDQNGMMLDSDQWRKIFKPRLQHVFSTLKKLNPEIKIAYHSCGSIRPVIADLVEIGLDILNPIQPLAKDMDAKSLKLMHGNEPVFFGGIDIQETLPKASPDEIRKYVNEKKSILGAKGGYIIAPAHNIQPDTPIKNVLAFFEAAKENC